MFYPDETVESIKSRAINLKRLGWKIEDISNELGISSKTVWMYTRNIPHPNNIHAKKPLQKSAQTLSIELAEILGYLSSEGCDYDNIDNHLGFDKRRGKYYRRNIKRSTIEFTNTDEGLKTHFKNIFEKVFGYSRNFKKNGNFVINRIEVVKYLRTYSRFGSKRWRVPKQITEGYKIMKCAFCRAFFDGDGTIEMNRNE